MASAGSAIVGLGEPDGAAAPEEDAVVELKGDPVPGKQALSTSTAPTATAAVPAIRRARLGEGGTDMDAPFAAGT